jgi:peptide/nickel transport system ATP-binding protein
VAISGSNPPVLLTVRRLTKTFRQRRGLFGGATHTVAALDDVSLDIARGRTLGIVGESGSGKSTLGRCLLRLTEPDAGTVTWHDRDGTTTDVTALEGEALRVFRPRMQVVFQDPYHSLNPARPVWQIVGEGLYVGGLNPSFVDTPRRYAPCRRAVAAAANTLSRGDVSESPLEGSAAEGRRGVASHEHTSAAPRLGLSSAAIRARAAAMLESVGLKPEHLDRLPHEFSGGQRQRIAIARALIVEPDFLVCDEVASALDTRTQAHVLELLRELQARTGVTLLFISHDLHTVAAMSDEIVVLRAGRIVERGAPARLFSEPADPYTRALIAAVPNRDPRRRTFRRARL